MIARRHIAAIATGAAGLLGVWAAAAGGGGPPTESGQTVADLLSGVEFVPSRVDLDSAMGDDANAELIAIAQGQDDDLDSPGQRIRAYRALSLYPSTATETALRAALATYGSDRGGVGTLYVRAAMDALARCAGDAAVTPIAPLLDHESLDVRADAAHALGLTGSELAIAPLSDRQPIELSEQVKLAITEALRILGETTAGTN
ncbi:MAG TPA: HEAT repeat domain-containing protein [Kofleriaceae bacterium]|nr:HEAT repeat domain-containing protein [Kofleriaceae bacterium]